MKAMIFAAGLGTRLKPFTQHHPKALVEVAGVTMLERVIHRLADAGFRQIVINIHHFPEQIRQFLQAHNNFGLDIAISDETEQLLDTGGGILHAQTLLDTDGAPFLVHNVDILSDIDLQALYRQHLASTAQASVLVAARDTQRYLLFDHANRLHGWTNVQTGELRPEGLKPQSDWQKLAFQGIHVISPSIFPRLREYAQTHSPAFSITNFYIDTCGDIDIRAAQPAQPYNWFDIGSPEKLQRANDFFLKG